MREPAKRFHDLVVWQKAVRNKTVHSTGFQTLPEWNDNAHQFVLSVYHLTESFPKTEMFGLSSQLRRSAISIAANIAEGFKKRGTADKAQNYMIRNSRRLDTLRLKNGSDMARFLNIAQGSLEESRYYLILTEDLGYNRCTELQAILTEVSKSLEVYSKTILNSDS